MATMTATAYTEAIAMALPRKLVTELLELPEEDRGTLAVLLWRSLEPDDGKEVTGKEWEATWGAVIERRMREVAEGKVELVDGDQVDTEIQALIDAPDP
jgi:Putative addiction module component